MSGIYIPGMEMPKSCGQCPLHKPLYHTQYCAVMNKNCAPHETIKEWCPLVSVPPHGRLIDADTFTKDECNSCDGACEAIPCDCLNCTADCRCDFIKDIANAPTIISAEGEII